MKKVILLAVVAIMMASCAETNEKRVEKAFKAYIETDFDNPEYFSEITSIEIKDTISAQKYIDMVDKSKDSVRKYCALMNKEDEFDEAYKTLTNCKSVWYVYCVKVRLNINGTKRIKEYYAIDKTEEGKIEIQDHVVKVNEAPDDIRKPLEMIMSIMN